MTFGELPPEVVEQIVVLLSLPDICSLRLSSRTIAFKATQDHFKTFFRRKRVEITEFELQRFVRATATGGLTSLIQHLTLIAPVYNTLELESKLQHKTTTADIWAEDGTVADVAYRDMSEDELSHMAADLPKLRRRQDEHAVFVASERCVELLANTLRSLARHEVSLESLATEVVVYRLDTTTPILPLYGGGWKYIWEAAGHVFHALFGSIARAGLRVDRLNLFDGSSMHRCSLSCDQFTSIDFKAPMLGTCLSHLKSLSSSISDKVMMQSSKEPMSLLDYAYPGEWEGPGDVFRSTEDLLLEASSPDNFTGFQFMLRRCTQLEELTISRYSLDWTTPEVSQVQTDGILKALQEAASSSVRRLTLQGLDTSESQVMRILSTLPGLECVSFRCIALFSEPRTPAREGTWRRILDHCTEQLNELHLDTLSEMSRQ